MKILIRIILLLGVVAANQNEDKQVNNQKSLRRGMISSTTSSNVTNRQLSFLSNLISTPYCRQISPVEYETVQVTIWKKVDSHFYETGDCVEKCTLLCKSKSYEAKNGLCRCVLLNTAAPTNAPIAFPLPTPINSPTNAKTIDIPDVVLKLGAKIPLCGENASFNKDTKQCECLAGFKGSHIETHGCYDINECTTQDDPCDTVTKNTRCINTRGSYQCRCKIGFKGNPSLGESCIERTPTINLDDDENQIEPTPPPIGDSIMTCDNEFGNPCGPDSLCYDTKDGFKCKALQLVSCPVGCSPGMECQSVMDLTLMKKVPKCVCKPGWYQYHPSFPCRMIKQPESSP